jgi:hypothetical protein
LGGQECSEAVAAMEVRLIAAVVQSPEAAAVLRVIKHSGE